MSTNVNHTGELSAVAPRDLNCYEVDQRIFNFTIDGRRFTAIEIELDSAKGQPRNRTNGVEASASGSIVGRIATDNIEYDIFSRDVPNEHGHPTAVEILTCRELQIANLIAEGKCDKEIARQLGISAYTVREHLRRTFVKLKVCRRSAVVYWMLRQPK